MTSSKNSILVVVEEKKDNEQLQEEVEDVSQGYSSITLEALIKEDEETHQTETETETITRNEAQTEDIPISVFRMKLLRAQLTGSHALLSTDRDDLTMRTFDQTVEKNILEGVEAISDIDRTIDSLRQWRIRQQQYNQKEEDHCFEKQPSSISPETEGEIVCEMGQSEQEAEQEQEQQEAEQEETEQEADQSSGQTHRLIQRVHDVFRDNPIIDRPVSDIAALQHSIEVLKRNCDSSSSPSQNNGYKVDLETDFSRINYEAVMSSHEKTLGLQQELLLQELECERNITSLVQQLDLLDQNLSSAILSVDGPPILYERSKES
eukprot:gene5036-5527_t